MGEAPSDIRVRCALTGTLEMPRVAGVIEMLAKLDGAKKHPPDMIRCYADQIYGSWLALQHRRDHTGYLVGDHAIRVEAERGITKELRRLEQVAKGTSEKRWRTAWLGVSGRTRELVMREVGPLPTVELDGELYFKVKALSAFYMIDQHRSSSIVVPPLADASELVEAALRTVEARPASQRKVRKSDPLLEDFERAVRVAFCDITGKRRGYKQLTASIGCYLQVTKNLPSKRF